MEFANWRAMRAIHAGVVYAPTCQKRANFSFLRERVNVPINEPTCQKACHFFSISSAKRCAKFSTIFQKNYIFLNT